QQREVGAEVELRRLLPLQLGVGQLLGRDARQVVVVRAAAEQAARREVAERLLVTRDTIARTQRQIVDHVLVLHEVLLADAIEDRRRRERAEAVRRAEARRAIAADVERRRDLVRVRVREAAEEREQRVLVAGRRAVRDRRSRRDVL